jgi:CelD/BcsL family acetyltransferase involved in cellulose biosynthesis
MADVRKPAAKSAPRVASTVPELLVVTDLGEWSAQWDRLVDCAAVPTPFLRSWWLAGTAGPRRRFLLVIDGGLLLGGLALEQGRRLGVPCFRMMGTPALCPDHLDVVARPGQEAAVALVLGRWLSRPGSRLLILEGVVATSSLNTVLPGSVRREPVAVAPWTPLPSDRTAYLDARPALFRRNLRRASARLEAAGASLQVRRGSAAVERLEVLRQLHDAQWGTRSNFLSSFDLFAAGCRLAAERDEISVHELIAGPTVVATLVAFEVARRMSLYQSARLTGKQWREASTVLLAAAISDACERGFTEVDFLRGDEPYKRNFTSQCRELVRLRAATGWLGHFVMIADAATRRARAAAARIVRRCERELNLRQRLQRRPERQASGHG